jgi:hypothetical protein
MTIYQYGPVAWAWRALIAIAMPVGLASLMVGFQRAELLLIVSALAMLAPGLFFGMVLAVRVDRLSDERLDVRTLLFLRRRIDHARLRTPRYRETYEADTGPMLAPRLWVPVTGSMPIYLDLLAHIPDRKAFATTFGVPLSVVPRRAPAAAD